ncbi:7548_t:CDS:2, partial [Racocetra persica]
MKNNKYWEKRQEISPEANIWNCEFVKSIRAANLINKILKESSTIYYK